MIIFTNNVFAGLLVVLVFAIDMYLLLIGIRCLVRRLAGAELTRYQSIICQIAETPVATTRCWLTRWHRRPLPEWLPWATVILAALVVREVLAAVVMATR
jgi:hypothetical protein